MSHFVERKQNNCLNCNAAVYGRYCHLCGQENVEPKESFWHLVTHFVYDVTHFDSKFFNTVKYLLLRPGFLSQEYMTGRRMRYLNPIKIYVFVSAFFFLFFFSVITPSFNPDEKETAQSTAKEIKSEIEETIKDLRSDISDKNVGLAEKKIKENNLKLLQQDLQNLNKDSSRLQDLNYNLIKGEINFSQYADVGRYDSSQRKLSLNARDGWLKRYFIKRSIHLKEKYSEDKTEFYKSLFEKFRHAFPQLLFTSLPLFALLLKLLYFKTKDHYYADHIIYSVHLYCAMFIFMFLLLTISHFESGHYLRWIQYFTTPLLIYMIWYQ